MKLNNFQCFFCGYYTQATLGELFRFAKKVCIRRYEKRFRLLRRKRNLNIIFLIFIHTTCRKKNLLQALLYAANSTHPSIFFCFF